MLSFRGNVSQARGMRELGTDPLTLGHTAISLIAIALGFILMSAMVGGQASRGLIQGFLLTTLLVSLTGYLFPQPGPQPTPGQLVGLVSIAVLAVAIFAFYARGLSG